MLDPGLQAPGVVAESEVLHAEEDHHHQVAKQAGGNTGGGDHHPEYGGKDCFPVAGDVRLLGGRAPACSRLSLVCQVYGR